MNKVLLPASAFIDSCKSSKVMKIIFASFFLCCFGNAAYAAVTVTAATGGTNICHNSAADGTAPAFTTLGTITISEGNNGDFANGADQLVINAPAGWQFNTGATVTFGLSAAPRNITAVTNGGFTATTITINITSGGVNRHDAITISGLQIQPTTQTSAASHMYASTATGVNGVTTGVAGTNFGNVSETGPTVYALSSGGGYCPTAMGFDLTLSGSNAGVNYQLYNSGVISGAAVAGGATPLDLGFQTAGTYTVLATDGAGCTSNMTGSATVVADPAPAVYTVTGTASVCPTSAGAYVDLNYSDIGVNYQLYNGALLITSLPGALTSLSFGPEMGGTYTVLATNTSTGCQSAMAGSAAITVLPAPTQFTVTGATSYCADVAGTDIGLSGSVPGTTYQLYNGAMAVGTPTFSATSSPLDFGIQPAGSYSVLATITATGCTGPMMNTLNVIENPLPNVYTVGGGGGYCMGGAGADITLSNSDAGVNYQAYNGSTATGASVAGTGMPPLPFDLGTYSVAGTYTVLATNGSTGCKNNMAGSTVVSINPLPALFNVTGGGGYCAGGLGVHVGLSGSASGINYSLYVGATFVSSVSGTTLPLDFGLQTTPGNYTVIGENAVTLCTSTMTGMVNVTVNPLPTAYALSPTTASYCAGGAGVDLTLSGSQSGVNYQVYLGSVMTGTVVPGGTTPLDLGFETAAGTYTVLATDATTFCQSGMTGSTTVSINPLPTVFTVTGGGSYCFGSLIGPHIGLSGSTSGVNYQLYDGAFMAGASMPGTGSALDFGPQLTAGVYTVLATDGTTFCPNNMAGSATVSVNPLPTVHNMTGGGAYCSGGLGVHVGLDGSDGGITYQLYDGASTSGSPVGGTGSAIDFGLKTTAGPFTSIATNTITGCTNNMAGSITVTVNPLPTAYTVTGGGTMCAGDPGLHVGLSWSDIGINYQLYRDGSPVGVPFPGIGGVLDFGVYSTGGNYLVVATDGTTFCQSLMTSSATIIVNPLPSAIMGTTSICVNTSTTLSDADAGGTWSSNDGTIATIGFTSGIMNGVGAGATTITYTLPTTCATTVPVVINPTPVVAAITGITNECVGFGQTLGDMTAAGVWSSTDGTIAAVDASGNVTGVAAGIVTISYSVTNGFGCVTAATTPDTVNALPVVGAIGGPTSVCIGIPTLLTNSTSGGVWMSGDITIATIDPSTGAITGVMAGAVDITYTVTSLAGCVTSVSTNETVNPSPSVSMINGPASVCTGLMITLSDPDAGGVWSSSDNTIATVDATGTVTGIAFGVANISYTETNGFGCSNSALLNLTVGNAMPVSTLSPGNATLCNGAPANIVLTTSGSGLTYQWSVNGNDIVGATNSSYDADTTGTIAITMNNGTCSETLTANISMPPHPVIGYNSAGNYLYTSTYSTYQWYKDGVPVTGANSSLFTPTGAGSYKVVVSDANGCYVASAPYTVTGGSGGGGGGGGGTAVSNTPAITDVKIYPNPAALLLKIDAPVTVDVTIISPDGKVVITQKQATTVDVSQLANGLYIIMVYDENSTLLRTEKFAKMN